jgi:hypothetical protein
VAAEYEVVLDTAREDPFAGGDRVPGGDKLRLTGRSVVVLRAHR